MKEIEVWYSAADSKYHTDGLGIFEHEADARQAVAKELAK